MLKVTNTERFKKEYKAYKQAIEKITNKEIKLKAERLLKQLLEQNRIIDEAHNSANSKGVNPKFVRENIELSVDIRLKLQNIVKDSKSS